MKKKQGRRKFLSLKTYILAGKDDEKHASDQGSTITSNTTPGHHNIYAFNRM